MGTLKAYKQTKLMEAIENATFIDTHRRSMMRILLKELTLIHSA